MVARRAKRIAARVAALALAGCVAFVAAEAVGVGGGGSVEVSVLPGESVAALADQLENKGVISSSLLFRAYLRIAGTPRIYPGVYVFSRNSSLWEALSVLRRHPREWLVVVRPGSDLAHIAAAVGRVPGHSAAAFLRLLESGTIRSPFQPTGSNDLEGLLGADTYEVSPGETDAQIAASMVQDFVGRAERVGLSPQGRYLDGLSAYEVVVVASIIEGEARYREDAVRVARVVYNRLELGMPLQMDSTVRYAAVAAGLSEVPKDPTKVRSPYNTYLYKGLPPSPIGTVSEADLEAALHPASGGWLYFVVVTRDGHEAFATTYQQHLENVALARERGVLQ
jgi:UPF0755 protein